MLMHSAFMLPFINISFLNDSSVSLLRKFFVKPKFTEKNGKRTEMNGKEWKRT